jgi:hypothetical protein
MGDKAPLAMALRAEEDAEHSVEATFPLHIHPSEPPATIA